MRGAPDPAEKAFRQGDRRLGFRDVEHGLHWRGMVAGADRLRSSVYCRATRPDRALELRETEDARCIHASAQMAEPTPDPAPQHLLLIGHGPAASGCSGDPAQGRSRSAGSRRLRDATWCSATGCTRAGALHADGRRQHSGQEVRRSGLRGAVAGPAALARPWCGDLVTDYRNGQWIDARSAHYVTGRHTSMQYGLGAQAETTAGSLDFAGARDHIYRVEQQFNIHGGNLEHPEPTSPPPIR